jgi:hypothetical protein
MKRCKDCVVGLFGACAPDYCRQERQGLIENAQWFAEQRGHVLSEFIKTSGQPVWQAQCVTCGLVVSVCLDPAPGEPDVHGEGLEIDCATPVREGGASRAVTAV